MSTLEDNILDGPRIHYVDDGNDDIREPVGENNKLESLFRRCDSQDDNLDQNSSFNPNAKFNGSRNTGPKGVIEDFKRQSQDDELEAEFQALMNDDEFIKEFLPKRFQEKSSKDVPTFGKVFRLQTGPQLLDAIDKENPNVLVIVHVYTKYSKPCANLNALLDELADELKSLKFVTLDASVTGLSENFKENGVPALLAYRSGQLVKSIIQLNELLDKNFNAADVKELLADNGLI